MDDKNWEYLLDSLEEEHCIICLGPGVYAEQHQRLEERLSQFLTETSEEMGIRVYDDGWFHYLPNASEIDAWQRVKEFYKTSPSKVEERLNKLSKLPGHFFLNFTPDYHLRDSFEQLGLAHDFLSYRRNEPYDAGNLANQHRPTRKKPLIYNMLGEVKKRNSLVMTYNDFYAYLESIFEDKGMAPVLKENIWEADYFVFLGMPFDKWYVHMFMRILQQHDSKRTSKKYAANLNLSEEVTTHTAEQYTMTFVPTGINDFLNTFYQKCEQRGLLRSQEEALRLELPYDRLLELTKDNAFLDIFQLLGEKLRAIGKVGESWLQQSMLLEGRYDKLQRDIRTGIRDQRDIDLETNRIRMAILELIHDLQRKIG